MIAKVKGALLQNKTPFCAGRSSCAKPADGGQGEATGKARGCLNAFSRRRQILAEIGAKSDILNELVPAIRTTERVIVFTERQEAAEQVAATLSWQGIRAGAVHSGLPTNTRRALLSQFAQGSLSVLCAPRLPDEGVDLPAAHLGIILAASQSRRRMGRVLRRKTDGRFARFVIAYVVGTSEDPGEGAHGAFLEDINDVADDVVNFGTIENGDGVCGYLNDYIHGKTLCQYHSIR